MGTKVNNFQNNAKNSNIILTQKSSETETNGSVTIFKNSEFGDIRTIVDPNGDVWFVAIDVARSLGYATPKNPIKRHVDEEDTILLQLSDFQRGSFWAPLEINELDSIRVINESGLYSLVLSSKLESAKKFKRWVTSEVLPSIRKTGSYSITPKDYPSALRALADEIDAKNRAIAERAQAEAERQQAIKTIEEQRPDVEFAESFKKVDNDRMWLIRNIAKKLEQNGVIIAEKNLRLFLEEVKFMFRNGQGRWELYSDIVKNKFGVYRSYFVDKYSGERVNQQTIYMTGAGYEVTLKGIKEKCRSLFLKYGKFEDPNF